MPDHKWTPRGMGRYPLKPNLGCNQTLKQFIEVYCVHIIIEGLVRTVLQAQSFSIDDL